MSVRWSTNGSPFRFGMLAVLTGCVAGIGAVLFRALIALAHNLFFLGEFSVTYEANSHTPAGPWGWGVVLVPVVGAVIVAFVVKNFAPEAKGHGVPEVMDAIYYLGGKIRPIVVLIKALASSITIGSGGSVGREGPIIQIGSAFGSSLGQVVRMPEWQRFTLVACGAGGGIAATFNTPIGGMLFAIEMILPEISARTLVPVAIATGAASYVGRAAFGNFPAFDIPALAIPSAHAVAPGAYLAYIILGVLLGLVSMLYIWLIYRFEDYFERIPGNYYTRHVGGMLLVGLMMAVLMHYQGHYYIQGIGYATVQDTLTGVLTDPWLLVMLFVVKLIATSLTLGSGGSGGVFSPSLFMGAVLGGAFAVLMNRIMPGLQLDVPGTAIIGMASIVGAATGAVLTAIVMIFEMTRDYDVIVPVIIAVAFAYAIRSLLLSDSIYTAKLSRRGHVMPSSIQTHLYFLRTALDFINTPVLHSTMVSAMSTLRSEIRSLHPTPHVLVADGDKLHSVLPASLLRRRMRRRTDENGVRLGDIPGVPYVVVPAEAQMFEVLAIMRAEHREVAVITRDGRLESSADALGVVTWDDIVEHSNLPRYMRPISDTKERKKPRTD